MEEILASIRRIISDEDGGAAPDESPDEDADFAEAANEEMSQDDLDALFDSPAPAEPEEEDPFDGVAASTEEEDAEAAFANAMAEPDEDDPGPITVEPQETDISFAEDDEDDEELELGPELEVEEEPPVSHPTGEPLMSPATDAVVSSAFGNLANMMLSKNARTLEDLVQEMLRPMLKTWLDDNLPGIVERMVKQEIERVTRGGGGFQ